MPIVENGDGKFESGDFWWEGRDSADESIWPAQKGDEIKGDHFEDLRKHMFLINSPNSGFYDSVHGAEDFGYQEGIAGYDANVISDPEHPSKLGIQYGEEINWDGYRWILSAPVYSTFNVFDDDRGLNNANLYSSEASWNAHKPPEQPDPSGFPTIFFNEFWRMRVDFNLYHEYDKYAPTYVAEQNRKGTNTYLFLGSAKELLPEQIDINLTHDGTGNNFDHIEEGGKNCVTGGTITRFYNDAKEFNRRFVTQIESLGTNYDPDFIGSDGSGNFMTYYTRQQAQFAGSFPSGDPLLPVTGVSNPNTQMVFEPKICAAYQNQLIVLLENYKNSIYLPTDNDDDFKKNAVEYRQWYRLFWELEEFDEISPFDTYKGAHHFDGPDRIKRFEGGVWNIYVCNFLDSLGPDVEYVPAGVFDTDFWDLDNTVWDPTRWEDHNIYAPIGDFRWGCNESGYESMLKYLGENYYDWYFDTEHPYFPSHWQLFEKQLMHPNYPSDLDKTHLEQQSPNVWLADYVSDEFDTGFPKPYGTWRRTFKYSLGRVDQRPTDLYQEDEDPSDSTDSHALTKTLMRPGSLFPDEACNAWVPLHPVNTHWHGNHDDDPIRGPGEHPAEFALWEDSTDFQEHELPWPGIKWTGDVKFKSWYGPHWDDLTVKQTILNYFNSSGETYHMYDPQPTCDSRPPFQYEELKGIYDSDPSSLTQQETELVEAHIAMNKRHDPVSIIDPNGEGRTEEYELYADMLNNMREMLMNSRKITNAVTTSNKEFRFGQDFGDIIAYDNIDDAYDELESLVVANFDGNGWETDPLIDGNYPDDGTFYIGSSFDFKQLISTSKYFHEASMYFKGGIGGQWSQGRFKIDEESFESDAIVKRWMLMSIKAQRDTAFYRRYPKDVTFTAGSEEITLGLETAYNDPILKLIPVESTDEGEWFVMGNEPSFPYGSVSPDNANSGGGTYNDFTDHSVAQITLDTTFMAQYDWDLIPNSVFNTENIKGISECPPI